MLIPAIFVSNLVEERQERQQQAIREVSSKWATDQTVTGPFLVIPYIAQDEKKQNYRATLYLLPDQLKIEGQIIPQSLNRSLYRILLYRSDLKLDGIFNFNQPQLKAIPAESILWKDARLCLGIPDTRGLEEEVKLNWNDTAAVLEAGLPDNTIAENGLSTPLPATLFDAQEKAAFNLHLKLKGSDMLYFTPVGKSTTASLRSAWRSPAFDGNYLPDTRQVNNEGFTAQWKILQVTRNYPQCWSNSKYEVQASAFGVKLVQPTDNYAKTQRSVKYALLFISLTFTIFFFLEILQKKQVHPLQYILVGLALIIFYTLLLSISEYTGFNPAYVIAASATILLITLYVISVFRKTSIALGFGAALAGLYTYIFVLIQLEDYALLCGSIGLFILLAILMYYSRKIDWYGNGRSTDSK
jgi:inner membrane protein